MTQPNPVSAPIPPITSTLCDVEAVALGLQAGAPRARTPHFARHNTGVLGYVDSLDYIRRPDLAEQRLAELLAGPQPIGIDIETCPRPEFAALKRAALDPHLSRVRLVQLASRTGTVLVLDMLHFPAGLLRPLESARLVAHNAVFEFKHLARLGIRLRVLHDTMLMGRVIYGARLSLKDLASRVLGIELDKEQQTSDWSAVELSRAQIEYAAVDAAVTLQIAGKLAPEVACTRPYQLMLKTVPVVADQELRGIPFDWPVHTGLCAQWRTELVEAETHLKTLIGAVNPRSPKQLGDWLLQCLDPETLMTWPRTPGGQLQLDRQCFARHEHHPLIAPLSRHRRLQKLLSVYGDGYTKFRNPVTDRIHPGFIIAGTAGARFSCSNPNVQQLPRDPAVRQLVAASPGRVLVCADYSQIELRIAAVLSCDKNMLAAYAAAGDLHRSTAAAIAGVPEAAVTKEQRQLAKAVNFGLLYGSGARGLQDYARTAYGIRLSEAQAASHRQHFFNAYPELRNWQVMTNWHGERSRAVQTQCGLVRRFEQYRMTEALNTPIQGTAAEVLLAALACLPAALTGLDAALVLHCHDEIVLDASAEDAVAAQEALVAAMTAGWSSVLPTAGTNGLLEARTGQTWADAK